MRGNRFWLLSSALLLVLLLGCEQEGPMERAGESVDETVEETGDALRGER